MSRGKYLSIEEARNMGNLNRFTKEHPSEGSEKLFYDMLNRMVPKVKKPKSSGRTSKKG
ncbi:MAG: hypothetical protein ACI9UO_002281 [Nitrospinales bacterium]|jgi:hypothetical protein